MSISTIAALLGGVSLAAGLLLEPGVAWAAEWVTGPTASIDSQTGDYTVSFKETGLPNTPVIDYELTAGTGDYTFLCFSRGNPPLRRVTRFPSRAQVLHLQPFRRAIALRVASASRWKTRWETPNFRAFVPRGKSCAWLGPVTGT